MVNIYLNYNHKVTSLNHFTVEVLKHFSQTTGLVCTLALTSLISIKQMLLIYSNFKLKQLKFNYKKFQVNQLLVNRL